ATLSGAAAPDRSPGSAAGIGPAGPRPGPRRRFTKTGGRHPPEPPPPPYVEIGKFFAPQGQTARDQTGGGGRCAASPPAPPGGVSGRGEAWRNRGNAPRRPRRPAGAADGAN